ncbi:MAG: helix-turn-helix domain-containing protein [Clostridia bacterium]|nr:helix-turn-helix domain-containing protein [Clostridia bacterium]
MRKQPDNLYTEKRKVAYTSADVIKLDTKCLYAGKLERIKKWNEKPHQHPFSEVLFVFSGSGTTVVDGKTYCIKKGDIIVYNPGTRHEESTSAKTTLEIGFFGITDFKISDFPSNFLLTPDSNPVIHTGKAEEKISFYFMRLIEEIGNEEKYNELIVKYLARLILIDILRLAKISEAKFVTNALFNQIHNYINKNFTSINSLDEVCNELHVSKYYISHVFKKYMGKPPMQYITSKRMDYAKKLLQETDLSATEIGEKCGYADHAMFFKAFKRMEGITPIAYRKETYSPGLKI